MNCKNVQSLLSAFIDEELSGREMLDIREHLAECNDCSEELRCVLGVKRMLCASAVPEPSPGFEDRLVSRVLAAAPAPVEKKISLISLTGIAAASMLVTMLLLNSMHREPPATAQVDAIPYDLMRQARAIDAIDRMGGSSLYIPTSSGR